MITKHVVFFLLNQNQKPNEYALQEKRAIAKKKKITG